MNRYACKFCVALYGLKATDVPALPKTAAEISAHIQTVHRYPAVSAYAILGAGEARQRAAQLIEEFGAVLSVRLIDRAD